VEAPETTKLVLEKCGTEVDDDEVLAEVTDEVFLLLVGGETYTPYVPQQIPDPYPSGAEAYTTGSLPQPSVSSSGTEVASGVSSGRKVDGSQTSDLLGMRVINNFIL